MADAGMIIVETAKGALDIVSAGLGALAGPLKTILIIVGSVIAVIVVIAISVKVAQSLKKKG